MGERRHYVEIMQHVLNMQSISLLLKYIKQIAWGVLLSVSADVKAGRLKVSVPEIKFVFSPIYSNPMAVISIPTLLNVKALRMIVPGFLNSFKLH